MPEQAYKRCTRCGESKPLDDFNRDRGKKDGRAPQCRVCHRARVQKWEQENPEKKAASRNLWAAQNRKRRAETIKRWAAENAERKAATDRASKQRNKDRVARQSKEHRERYPEKASARLAVAHAVSRGLLIKPDHCEDCNRPTAAFDLHGHHADYSQPLKVEWLCRKCHASRHT